MLVIEITLPKNLIEIGTQDAELWRRRAATTLAEALRLSASRILDIEFTDIQAGYRTRHTEDNLYLDVYLYDSLSSGAGYSSRIAEYIDELLIATKTVLANCPNNCQHACNNCLKHYRNQYLQDDLDRHAALQLLSWGMSGNLPLNPSEENINGYFKSIGRLLREEGIEYVLDKEKNTVRLNCGAISKECVVHAAMKKMNKNPNTIYVTAEALEDAKPFAIDKMKIAFGIH
jgi:hypothetical protein